VNLGIVLAMAGIDYSFVKEPDYDRNYSPQESRVTDYIKRLKDPVLDNYFNPKQDSTKPPAGQFVSRHKNIYYDTDGIQESQKESIMMCNDCRGVLMIETSSSVNHPSAGIEIPVDGCKKCQAEGYSLYETSVKSKKYQTVQLTDRVKKVYERTKR
jgi:hypothetical protein